MLTFLNFRAIRQATTAKAKNIAKIIIRVGNGGRFSLEPDSIAKGITAQFITKMPGTIIFRAKVFLEDISRFIDFYILLKKQLKFLSSFRYLQQNEIFDRRHAGDE